MGIYPHSVTSWIDTEQPEVARVFYGGLFGWRMTDARPPGGPGSYLIATIGGQDVVAVSPMPAAAAAIWNTYVAVDNADAAADGVTARLRYGDHLAVTVDSGIHERGPRHRPVSPTLSAAWS